MTRSSLRDLLITQEQVPSVYKEPYILTGYRREGTSIQACLRYIFVSHNDVGNFWTHFIPFWIWLGWLFGLSTSINLADPYWWPLLGLWFSGCCYTLCSSLAHMLNCMSSNTLQLMFMLDYHAIIMYGLAECLAYYHYERPIGQALSEHTAAVTAFHLFTGASISLLCCLARLWMCKHYRVIVTLLSALIHGISTVPLIWRLWMCVSHGEQCIPETFRHHILILILPLPCVFFFISRCPERLAPGYFDYILQSHQLFHTSCVLHTSFQMYVLPIDAALRRDDVATRLQSFQEYGTHTLLFLFIVVTGVLVILFLHWLVRDTTLQERNEERTSTLNRNRRKLKEW